MEIDKLEKQRAEDLSVSELIEIAFSRAANTNGWEFVTNQQLLTLLDYVKIELVNRLRNPS